ncbi:hypothetical protein C0Q70_07858 [Pomacea canaliculata]|uniref:Uncharacterized protein n=1 Tax=Pomacea canaliculata TaxID=400727 RepID=A0A2T7PG87_POMCA|nr:hypothetical protein C0Q70_07858 [Pomacea canaliculata]
MSENLSLETLQLLSPFTETGNDMVTEASRDLVLSCIKTDPRVHDVFFPSFAADPLQESLDLRTFPTGPLAVTLLHVGREADVTDPGSSLDTVSTWKHDTGTLLRGSVQQRHERFVRQVAPVDPQSVIPAYQHLLNQKALPAVHLELATRNYLGGPLDWRAIQFEVENAERKPSTPLGLSRLSLSSQIDVFHGMAVDDFVVTECRNLGLWSGLRPENAKVSKPTNKCFVM